MHGSRCQGPNVGNFARKKASLIAKQAEESPDVVDAYRRVYKCKDCDKKYYNFQALGGHRASHKKVRPETGADSSGLQSLATPPKPKLHECNICKMGFAIGQALGGHMRKHRDQAKFDDKGKVLRRKKRIWSTTIVPYDHLDSCSSSSSTGSNMNRKPVLDYDLNLTPQENESMNGVRLENQNFREPS